MLVVCHDAFVTAMLPFVAWKTERGSPVEMITTSSVGDGAERMDELRDRLLAADFSRVDRLYQVLGALAHAGIMEVTDQHGETGVGLLLVEHYNLFGDCSLVVRTASPAPIAVDHQPVVPRDVPAISVATDAPHGAGRATRRQDDAPQVAAATVSPGGVPAGGIVDDRGRPRGHGRRPGWPPSRFPPPLSRSRRPLGRRA